MNGGAAVATLPMYDFPEVAAANDALWQGIANGMRARAVAAPDRLTRGRDLGALWRDPNHVFGQTCGYPYVTSLSEAVVLIATPEYSFPGCDGPMHRSFLVARENDPRRALDSFRGGVAAINSLDSNSGMNLFRASIAPVAAGRKFFGDVVTTGSHRASLAAIADGFADLAAIDCVSFGLIKRFDPHLVARIAVVAESVASPGLPFIASAKLPETAIASIREALFAALSDPKLSESLAELGIVGARVLPKRAYEGIREIERQAQAAGYPRLA
jgi:ABC-type phosphate/phosphonate transport system substrate-binding protein